jgi:hypothetical protein
MNSGHVISMTVVSEEGKTDLHIPVHRLVVAGWVGKDRKAVQDHIDELVQLGVPAPQRVPTYMNLSPFLLTTAQTVEVISPNSSGEVESVLIRHEGRLYLGAGSDHTDREVEKYDIPTSKQMCSKILAPVLWKVEEVESHLDGLVLRSWMTSGGSRNLYQESSLGVNRSPMELLEGAPEAFEGQTLCLFCGTFPSLGGIVCGEHFDFEIHDPVMGRTINHGYDVRVLSQHV